MAKGRSLVLLMLCAGLALGGYAWLHRRESGKRVLQAWGDYTALVRHASGCDLLVVSRETEARDPSLRIQIAGRSLSLERHPIELSKTPGVIHARHALIEDFNFDWTSRPAGNAPQWEVLLRFREKDGAHATLAFDLSTRVVRLLENDRQLSMKPELAQAFRKKFDEWQAKAAGQKENTQEPHPERIKPANGRG